MTACPLSFVIRLPGHLSQATSLALDVPFLGRPYDPPVLGGELQAAHPLDRWDADSSGLMCCE